MFVNTLFISRFRFAVQFLKKIKQIFYGMNVFFRSFVTHTKIDNQYN